MKKTIYTLVASCLFGITANAQIMLGYDFKAESGTYIAKDACTAIATGNDEIEEEGEAAKMAFFHSGLLKAEGEVTGYSIGFDFKFGDEIMTTFGVSPSGYIILGGSDAFVFNPTRSWYVFSTDSEATNNVVGIALGNTRMGDTSSIGYVTEGEAPNRTLTIQLSNILVSLNNFNWSNPGTMDLQYILSESDNSIKMVFNNCNNFPVDNTINCRYGLRAGYKQGLAVSASEAWINAVGVPGSDGTIAFGNGKVEDGLTCTFSYPKDCVVPSAQPTDLMLSSTATTISYGFSTSDAEVYLVVYANSDEAPSKPVNGVNYSKGDNLGVGKIAYFGAYQTDDYKRVISELTSSTLYSVYVYAANAYGANGPVYLTENPLIAAVSTTPEAPESLAESTVGLTTFTGNVQANNAEDQVVVIYSTKWNHNIPYASTPDYGSLSGTYTVGDLVEEGHDGRVGYIGTSGEFTIENIPVNSPLMVAAYSLNSDGVYSDVNLQVITSTVCSMPYEPNMNQWCGYTDLPAGWKTTGNKEFSSRWNDSEFDFLETTGLKGSAEEPQQSCIILPPMMIDQRYVDFTLEWRGALSTSRFAKEVWKMTNDNDYIAMRVSEDGENWTTVGKIDKDNAPTIEDTPENTETGAEEVSAIEIFSPMKGDLSAYVGKKVYVSILVSNTQPGFFGLTFDVRDIKLQGAPIPVVPVVAVGTVTYNSAEITWRGEQESYAVQYGTSEASETEIITIDTNEKAILLENLVANTDYKVRVRGLAEDPDDYSEWSEWNTFRTKDWPVVEEPSNLTSVVNEEAQTVTLSWSNNEDYINFTLRYRAGDVLEWTTVEGIADNSYVLPIKDLQPNVTYLWSVRANCTHERQTIWATQQEFIIVVDGLSSVMSDDENVVYYTVDGKCLGNDISRLPKGSIVITKQDNKAVKRIIK